MTDLLTDGNSRLQRLQTAEIGPDQATDPGDFSPDNVNAGGIKSPGLDLDSAVCCVTHTYYCTCAFCNDYLTEYTHIRRHTHEYIGIYATHLSAFLSYGDRTMNH